MKFTFMKLLATLLILGCISCNGKITPKQEPFDLGGMLVYECTSTDGGSNLCVTDLLSGKSTVLTDTWKIDMPGHPVFAADGRHIIFQARETGKWNLYLYDLTTGKLPENLTKTVNGDCKNPSLSPDGKTILFTRNNQISSMDLDSRSVKAITFDAGATYTNPVFADGDKIVIYEYTADGKSQLGRLGLASGSSKSILFDTNVNNCQPITYGSEIIYIKNAPSGSSSLMSATTSGANPSEILASSTRLEGPCLYKNDYILVASDGGIQAVGRNDAKTYAIRILAEGKLGCSAYWPESITVATPEDGGRTHEGGDDITSDTDRPTLKGKLVYHNYTAYDTGDSQMYIYDFATNTNTNISRNWNNVNNMMNGHFSPDGRYITFMGIGTQTGSWDIFLYDTVAGGQPVNLTPSGSYRDEDPKYSNSGNTIVFKRNGHIAEITVATKAINVLSKDNTEEYGMPYYNSDDTKILSGVGAGSSAYIGVWDKATAKMSVIFDRKGETDYYPINIDRDAFYFTTHEVGSAYDQLYKGFWNGATAISLPFNTRNADYSDAYPISKGWLFLVSSRRGGKGQYDLYIANENSGAIYSLSLYNSALNTSKNELGPAYFVEK